MPKSNNYQSLHTTVIDSNGETFEVQIRTYEMHQTAEYGIAAHWKYKSGATKSTSFDENLTWLRQLLEWQKDVNDADDFMETLKIDFFADEVFVFTPNGDVVNLPEGSTPIDFAYRIHSQVGNTCVGAKISGRIVPLTYKLKSGDIVSVITNPNSGPSLDWLNIVKSPQAKKKIQQYFKVKDRDKNIERGRDMLVNEAKRIGYKPFEFLKDEWLEEVRSKLNISTIDDMYAAVGFGTISVNQVTAKLVDIYKRTYKDTEDPTEQVGTTRFNRPKRGGIVIDGIDDVKVRFAKCCNPVPGDDIIGYVTIGRGVSVHRADCPNLKGIDENRIVDVSWNQTESGFYSAQIEVMAFERATVISDIANKISDSKLEFSSLSARKGKDHELIVDLTVEIKSIKELEKLIEKIKKIKHVYDVYRVEA